MGGNRVPNPEHRDSNAHNVPKYWNFPCSYSSFRHKNLLHQMTVPLP